MTRGGMGGAWAMPMGGGGLGIGNRHRSRLVGWPLASIRRVLIAVRNPSTGGSQSSSYKTIAAPPFQDGRDRPTRWQLISHPRRIDDAGLIFQPSGQTILVRAIVLFSRTPPMGPRACGMAQSAMGPFYCPRRKSDFLDTGFFREIETGFRVFLEAPASSPRPISSPTRPGIISRPSRHPAARDATATAAGSKGRPPNALPVCVECRPIVVLRRGQSRRRRSVGFHRAGDIDASFRTASGDRRRYAGIVSDRAGVPIPSTHGSSEQRKLWFHDRAYQQEAEGL